MAFTPAESLDKLHPDYGYPAEYRKTVMAYAVKHSVAAAAAHFGLH